MFSLFVVHDYLIEKADADTQYELCYAENGKMALDLPSQIHNHIHLLLDVPLRETHPTRLHLADAAPESFFASPDSHTSTVLPRPPLH